MASRRPSATRKASAASGTAASRRVPSTNKARGATPTKKRRCESAARRSPPRLLTSSAGAWAPAVRPTRPPTAAHRLTTQQGIPVADDQNTLRLGARGPAALEDFHFREKIFHFDHERIPERVVHARGYGAHGFFESYESLADVTARRPVPGGRPAHRGVRPLLHRGRQQGFVRPRPRRPRLRRQVLHAARATGTWSATTSRCSSSRTRSSSRISCTR